jgi:hypothetical protein
LDDPVNLVDPFGLWGQYTWPYSWKSWAGVTLALAGLAIAPESLVIGGIMIGASVIITVWDAFETPDQVESETKEMLEPIQESFDERMKEYDELEGASRGCP